MEVEESSSSGRESVSESETPALNWNSRSLSSETGVVLSGVGEAKRSKRPALLLGGEYPSETSLNMGVAGGEGNTLDSFALFRFRAGSGGNGL